MKIFRMKWNTSRMQHRILTVFFITSLFALISCQKKLGQSYSSDDPAVEKIHQWFANEVVATERSLLATPLSVLPAISPTRLNARMGKLESILAWNDAIRSISNGTTITIVPVREAQTPFVNKDVEASRSLVFYENTSGDIKMKVVEVIAKAKTSLPFKKGTIEAMAFRYDQLKLNEPVTGVNASIFIYNDHYQLENTYQLKEGQWKHANMKVSNRAVQTKRSVNATMLQSNSCVKCHMVYLVLYWFWEDTYEITDYTILSEREVCTGEMPDASWGDASPLPTQDDCTIAAQSELTNMANATAASDELLNIATEEVSANRRVKTYTWKVLANVTWGINSTERGRHKRVENTNPDLQWEWESLEHVSMEKTGFVAGGKVDYHLVSAIPSWGKYHAIMEIKTKVEYSTLCMGVPFSREEVYTSSKIFNVND